MAYSNAKLVLDNQTIDIPLATGTDGSQALDINELREKTGLLAYDRTLNNTAIAKSAITWIDSKNGKLLYRGINIQDLVDNSTFVETSYLLSFGVLPDEEQLRTYSNSLSKHSMIHESMRNFFDAFPGAANPLAILTTMVTALSSYYPLSYETHFEKGIDIKTRLLAKVRTLAAWSYKKSIGHPFIYPIDELPYCQNFLNMMFAVPAEQYMVPPDDDKILNQILILYSDHEQNVSTSTIRLVGSSEANLFACVNAGLCALWGAREAHANIPPIPMLEHMLNHQMSPEKYFERFIQGREVLRSNGLGHKGYDVEDPRSRIGRKLFHAYYKANKDRSDPLIQKALEVEEFTLGHTYFKEMRLYPNVDFYSALIFRMIGIPSTMNNVIRAIGKLSGWLAHWHEQRAEGENNPMRPHQIYVGQAEKPYIPLRDRK